MDGQTLLHFRGFLSCTCESQHSTTQYRTAHARGSKRQRQLFRGVQAGAISHRLAPTSVLHEEFEGAILLGLSRIFKFQTSSPLEFSRRFLFFLCFDNTDEIIGHEDILSFKFSHSETRRDPRGNPGQKCV